MELTATQRDHLAILARYLAAAQQTGLSVRDALEAARVDIALTAGRYDDALTAALTDFGKFAGYEPLARVFGDRRGYHTRRA